MCKHVSRSQSAAVDLLMEVVMVNVCQGQAIKQNRASVRVVEALH